MFKKIRFNKKIKSRKVMYSALVFVLIAITTMTIAYATLSTTLRITGSAEFEDASWSFILEEHEIPDYVGIPDEFIDGNVISYGSAKLKKKPTLLGTSISDFQISLSKLGDGLVQYYQLTNTGEIPARLESVVYSEPEFDSDNEEEIELAYENFVFSAGMFSCFLEDGELICGGDLLNLGDIICPGATYGLSLYTGYNSEAPRVPYEAMTISNLGLDVNFVAADQNLCDGSTPIVDDEEENG